MEAQPNEADSALDQQQDLLESSLHAVFSAFDEATSQGMVGPVVFVLDCEDQIGGEVARAWLGAEAIGDAIEQRQLLEATEGQVAEETTIFVYAFPFDQCSQEVPRIFPYLGAMFEQPLPQDGVLAIVVASGGASALTVPFSARESSK